MTEQFNTNNFQPDAQEAFTLSAATPGLEAVEFWLDYLAGAKSIRLTGCRRFVQGDSAWITGNYDGSPLGNIGLAGNTPVAIEFRPLAIDPESPDATSAPEGNFILYFKPELGWEFAQRNPSCVGYDNKDVIAHPDRGNTWVAITNGEMLRLNKADFLRDNLPGDLKTLQGLFGEAEFYLDEGLNCLVVQNNRDALRYFNTGLLLDETSIPDADNLALVSFSSQYITMWLQQPGAKFNSTLADAGLVLQKLDLAVYASHKDIGVPSYGNKWSVQTSLFDAKVELLGSVPGLSDGSDYELGVRILEPIDLTQGLKDLTQLVEGPDIELPEGFPVLKLNLYDLILRADNGALRGFSASLGLQDGEEKKGWTIIKDWVVIKNLGLMGSYDKEGGSSFRITGAMQLFGYEFDMSYTYPGDVFTGNLLLADPDSMAGHLEDFFKKAGIEGLGKGLGSLAAAFGLSVYYDHYTPELEITVDIWEDWTIGPLTISDVQFQLLFADNDKGSLQFSESDLRATLSLPLGHMGEGGKREDVDIRLEASYEAYDKRWLLSGETFPGEGVALGEAVEALIVALGGGDPVQLPEALHSLTLENILLRFDNKGFFEFACEADLILEGERISVKFYIRKEGSGSVTVAASLVLSYGYEFDLVWDKSGTAQTAVANLSGNLSIDAKHLLRRLSPEVAELAPIDLDIALEGVLLAFSSTIDAQTNQKHKEFLFRLILTAGVDFSSIPLIGEMLPGELGFKHVQLIAANKSFQDDAFSAVNTTIATIQPQPPDLPEQQNAGAKTVLLDKGLSICVDVNLGYQHHQLYLNFGGEPTPPKTQPGGTAGGEAPAPVPNPKPDARSTVSAKQSFGAVQIAKLGLAYHNNRLGLVVTGSVTLGPVSLSLIGLEISSPLKKFEPHFALEGLGLELQSGPVELGGAFLRKHYPAVGPHAAYDEYAGLVQLKFNQLQLAGVGMYASYDGHPSLFAFVSIGFPIGGPPAFFVTGLAGGFGVNRDLVLPGVRDVEKYPLVALADPRTLHNSGATGLAGLAVVMEKLHDYIPPRVGAYFLVAGVRFQSFGLINTVGLVAVKLDRNVEIDVIGVSSVILPAGFFELNFRVRCLPEEGYIIARGELSARSYLYVPEVHLSGGFAAAFWFDPSPYSGDFVITVGGYHPQYAVPDHYPKDVSRLAINWQLSNEMSIKAGVYFAITPKVVMAGGFMDAAYTSGLLSAWLKINANFIIWWEPYHYDAQLSIEVGVRVTIPMLLFDVTLEMTISAGLHLWGPELSGVVMLDVGPKTFVVEFGAHAPQYLPGLDWKAFKKRFIAQPEAVCTSSVQKGLKGKMDWKFHDGTQAEVWIVNAKELVLVADSVVPAQLMDLKGATLEGTLETAALGLAPMKDNCQVFSAKHRISIFKMEDDGSSWTPVPDDHFKATPITKNVPAAIWGDKLPSSDPADKAGNLVENALCGFVLTPGKDPESSASNPIDRDKLVNDEDDFFEKFGIGAAKSFISSAGSFAPSVYKAGNTARNALLDTFGIEDFGAAELDLDDFKDGDLFNFTDAPAAFQLLK